MSKPKTPFEKAGYTKDTKFKFIGERREFEKGETVWLGFDDNTPAPFFTNGKRGNFLYFEGSDKDLEVIVENKKLKFPCCVPTFEIRDEDSFKKLIELFVANGAREYETDYGSVRDWGNFGVDNDGDTVFYSRISSYSENRETETDVTVYTVEELLSPQTKIEPVNVTPVVPPTLFPVGTYVKIAESSEWYKDRDWGNPKDTKGIVIRSRPEGIDDFCYRVEWDDGTANTYRLDDLVLWEEEPTTEDNPWIEWNGGISPPSNLPVHAELKFRDGDIQITKAPHFYRWSHYNDYDIIAYREYKPSVASCEAITDVSDSKHSVAEPVYKVGDSVVIVDTDLFNKDFVKAGDVATVEEIRPTGRIWLSCPTWGTTQICRPEHIKPFEEVTEEVQEDPLLSVELDITYKVTIKGVELNLTQEELDEIWLRLGVLTSYEEDDCE